MSHAPCLLQPLQNLSVVALYFWGQGSFLQTLARPVADRQWTCKLTAKDLNSSSLALSQQIKSLSS